MRFESLRMINDGADRVLTESAFRFTHNKDQDHCFLDSSQDSVNIASARSRSHRCDHPYSHRTLVLRRSSPQFITLKEGKDIRDRC